MLGLREPLVLDRDHYPTQRQPALPGRLGIGPVAPRDFCGPRYVERWGKTIVLAANRSGNGTGYTQSDWIHQPFLVRRMSVKSEGAGTNDILWKIAATQGLPTTTVTEMYHYWSWFDHQWRGAVPGTTSISDMLAAVEPGTIIRNVPCRIVFAIQFTVAAWTNAVAMIDVTFLAEDDRPKNPHPGCSSCPLERT